MRRILAITLITFAASLPLYAQQHSGHSDATPRNTPTTPTPRTAVADTGGWVKFTSDQGRFSVLLPEAPSDKAETQDSDHGPYTTHLFIVRDAVSVYLVGWVDYDPSFNFNRQAELEANRDNFVKGIQAKLISTRATVFDGYSALEFVAETEDRVFTSRVYMVGRRPYQIVIGSPKDQDDTVTRNRFFNSFKVTLR